MGIPHSEFARFVDNIQLDGKPLPHTLRSDLVHVTRNGVMPEGALIHPDYVQTVNQASDNSAPPLPGTSTGFVWGRSSLAELKGVKSELVECSTLALTRFSKVDFRCHDGLRTIEEQRRHLRNGTTRTMNSKHLPQADGFSHAVDLVPIIDGVLKWDWDGCFEIAWAMDQAATHMGIARHIRWGGAWDRVLADYGNYRDAYRKEVQAYKNRHPGPDFIDGPHFEWVN